MRLAAPDDETFRSKFGDRLQASEPLARYTSARIGGPAEYLFAAETAADLAEAAREAYRLQIPFFVLGGGSNVLAADAGVRGLVIVNRAKEIVFGDEGRIVLRQYGVSVRAESGCSMGALARQCVLRGYAGLEWAATVPGTVGGAVYGNAGAHGGDTASCLRLADILQQDGTIRNYAAGDLQFGYRTSVLKKRKEIAGAGSIRQPSAVVIAAEFGLTRDEPAKCQARVEELVAQRKRTQPPGASIGSMFKNPPGDYAGRLIEAAGLKGKRIGRAEISTVHGNFFVNLGEARAADVKALIDLARETVRQRFDVELELEIELVGEWER